MTEKKGRKLADNIQNHMNLLESLKKAGMEKAPSFPVFEEFVICTADIIKKHGIENVDPRLAAVARRMQGFSNEEILNPQVLCDAFAEACKMPDINNDLNPFASLKL